MTSTPLTDLADAVASAVVKVGGEATAVKLERPADESHGDYATAVAMSLARTLRASPREIATQIAAALDSPLISSVEVAGPGFINIRVAPEWYRQAVTAVIAQGERFGAGAAADPKRIQVEYVSGNPTGPVTASTARNAAYGDSLARLFAFAGHAVEREYYFNDAGRQMDLFGASLRARARGEEPGEDGYQGTYIKDIADRLGLGPDASADEYRERGVEVMIAEIKTTLERFRATFDSWFLERSLYEDGSVDRAIARLEEGGHTFRHEGALWLRSTEFGDDRDRVLVRSDGNPTYIAGDVAYIVNKLERGFDIAVYVLGSDHHGYVGRLKAAAARSGTTPTGSTRRSTSS